MSKYPEWIYCFLKSRFLILKNYERFTTLQFFVPIILTFYDNNMFTAVDNLTVNIILYSLRYIIRI